MNWRPPSRFRRRIEDLRYDLELLAPVARSFWLFLFSIFLNAGCVVLGIAMARALGII